MNLSPFKGFAKFSPPRKIVGRNRTRTTRRKGERETDGRTARGGQVKVRQTGRERGRQTDVQLETDKQGARHAGRESERGRR